MARGGWPPVANYKLVDLLMFINVMEEKTEEKQKRKTGGNICCFPNCHVNSVRGKGIHLFKPTSRPGEFYEKWNKEIFNIILRYRVDDENFKNLRTKRKIYICERHYKKDDIELTPCGKNVVKLCALPTENLPSKSHETFHAPRNPPKERNINIKPDPRLYKDFNDVSKKKK